MRSFLGMVVVLLAACSPSGVVLVGVERFDTTATVSFGAVELGAVRQTRVSLRNENPRAVTLVRVSRLAGDPARVPPFLDEPGAVFGLDDFGALDVGPHEARLVALTYDPPPTSVDLQHRAELELVFATATGEQRVTVTLEGAALPFACEVPQAIDFGGLRLGESATVDYVFDNERDTPDQSVFEFSDRGPFSTLSTTGTLTSQGRQRRTVSITFKPTAEGPFTTTAEVARSRDCPRVELRISGDGVLETFGVTLPEIPWTPVGSTFRGEVLVTSTRAQPTTFTTRAPALLELPGTFIVPAATRDGATLRPARLAFPLVFSPTAEHEAVETVVFTSDDARSTAMTLTVPVRAGSPRAAWELTSRSLQLPWAGAEAPREHALVRFPVRSVGTASADPAVALRVLGANVTSPTQSARQALCFGTFQSRTTTCEAQLPVGIPSGAGLDLIVDVMPLSPGHHEYDLEILTNEPASQVLHLTVDSVP